jgi:2Fe-2S ferredoxin
MPNVTYIHPDGRREDVEVVVGLSIMQGATQHGIDGIVAECGGNAMCATCHVYIDPEHIDRLPVVKADEDALLEGTASERRANSRLSCQIQVTPELDGLIVHLPESQI